MKTLIFAALFLLVGSVYGQVRQDSVTLSDGSTYRFFTYCHLGGCSTTISGPNVENRKYQTRKKTCQPMWKALGKNLEAVQAFTIDNLNLTYCMEDRKARDTIVDSISDQVHKNVEKPFALNPDYIADFLKPKDPKK